MSGMHLLGPAYSTTNTRKRKAKNKTKKLLAAEAEHEKFLQKMGVGKSKHMLYDKWGKRVGVNEIPDYREHQSTATLSNRVAANGVAREQQKYTGDEIAGIVVTHKSNLMPVRKDNKQAAKDAASMRR